MSKIRASKQVNASGTPSSTTFLRGDDTWATPVGGAANSSTRVYATGTITLNNGTLTVIPFNNETRDELSAHDNVTNNSRVTVGATGRYRITGQSGAAACQVFVLEIYKNGSGGTRLAVTLGPSGPADSEQIYCITAGTVDLTAGDYVELYAIAFKASGSGSTTVDGPAADTCWFEVERVS